MNCEDWVIELLDYILYHGNDKIDVIEKRENGDYKMDVPYTPINPSMQQQLKDVGIQMFNGSSSSSAYLIFPSSLLSSLLKKYTLAKKLDFIEEDFNNETGDF